MTSLDVSAFPEIRVVRAGALGRSWSDRALVQTDANNWAPQLGVAFQPGPLWTMRAAAGLFYGTPKGVGAAVYLLNNWPQTREVTVPSTATRSAGQLADGIDQTLLGAALSRRRSEPVPSHRRRVARRGSVRGTVER